MRIKPTTAAAAVVDRGQTFEPDEHGFFDVPFELAQSLISTPFWDAEEPRVYFPELEAEPEPELTPAEKGALTKAANAAAAAAEAKAAEEAAAAEAAKPKI